jgi:hypothetical protein
MLHPRLGLMKLIACAVLFALPALACGQGAALVKTPEIPLVEPSGKPSPAAPVDYSTAEASPILTSSPAADTPKVTATATPVILASGQPPATSTTSAAGSAAPNDPPATVGPPEAAATPTPVHTPTPSVEEDDPAGDALDQALKELDSYFENTDTLDDLK